jgi:hypothetical protein
MRNAMKLSVRKPRFHIPISHSKASTAPRTEALPGRNDRHVPALAKPSRAARG